MAITFSIAEIIALIFILLYLKENEKCETLKRGNGKLREGAVQKGSMTNAAMTGEYDSRRLDRDLILEAIRFNGFVPEVENNLIFFNYDE